MILPLEQAHERLKMLAEQTPSRCELTAKLKHFSCEECSLSRFNQQLLTQMGVFLHLFYSKHFKEE